MSGGGQNTVTSTSVPSWLQPYLTSSLSAGQTLAQGAGPQYYPGQQVAPLNQVQEQGIGQIQNTANNTAGQATPGATAANQFETSGALLNPASNPYLQGTFTQAANSVQNQLSSEFAGSGRNITGSLPIQSDEMNNLATQLYGGQYDTGLNTMTQASALAPTLDQASYLPGQENLSTGAGLQGQTQNLINANMNAYNYNEQLPYNQLSWYSGLVGQNATPFSSTSSSTSQSVNPWTTGVGAAAAGAGLLGGAAELAPLLAASDVRVKKHINRVGATDAGIPVYHFRYVWDADDAPIRTGVMAHEVAATQPEAVSKHPHGYLMVDYNRIR